MNRPVDMPGIMIRPRRLLGIKTIDVFKVRSRGVEPDAVDDHVPVIADAHVFAATSDKPLDVMGLLDQTGNMIRVKDNNFSAPRRM